MKFSPLLVWLVPTIIFALIWDRLKWTEQGLFVRWRDEGVADEYGVRDAELWAKFPFWFPGARAYFRSGKNFSRGEYTL